MHRLAASDVSPLVADVVLQGEVLGGVVKVERGVSEKMNQSGAEIPSHLRAAWVILA
jgi:hypothetical protein